MGKKNYGGQCAVRVGKIRWLCIVRLGLQSVRKLSLCTRKKHCSKNYHV